MANLFLGSSPITQGGGIEILYCGVIDTDLNRSNKILFTKEWDYSKYLLQISVTRAKEFHNYGAIMEPYELSSRDNITNSTITVTFSKPSDVNKYGMYLIYYDGSDGYLQLDTLTSTSLELSANISFGIYPMTIYAIPRTDI